LNSPSNQDWLVAMQQGQQLFQSGRLEESLQVFDKAARMFPGKAEGWGNLGVVQIQAGQAEQAIASLRRAISLDPRLMPAYLAIGDALRLTGRHMESVAAFRRAVALEKTPEGLNKLACGLRKDHKREEAEALYREALAVNPQFSLARVNLATVQVELERFEEAALNLRALEGVSLPANERDEIDSTRQALQQFQRVRPAIEKVLSDGDISLLRETLHSIPESGLPVDEEIIGNIRAYAAKAEQLPSLAGGDPLPLPDDWPMIEAMFMIPYVTSVEEYREVRQHISTRTGLDGDLLESANMEAVVTASRSARHELGDPVTAELQLRHWHALATRGVPNTFPGHFKITTNEVFGQESKRRVRPHMVSGTVRYFFREIYAALPPGLPRGLVTMMAISDIHPFYDGNGRLAQTFLNRELEWTGQMPVLFTRDLGIAGGAFVKATGAVRRNTGSFEDVVAVVERGQQFARRFCGALETG
jgi:Flp pilus assembly protein TadD